MIFFFATKHTNKNAKTKGKTKAKTKGKKTKTKIKQKKKHDSFGDQILRMEILRQQQVQQQMMQAGYVYGPLPQQHAMIQGKPNTKQSNNSGNPLRPLPQSAEIHPKQVKFLFLCFIFFYCLCVY